MEPFKILHVINIVADRYGGAGIASQLMATYQAKMGHKVTICTTNVDFPKGIIVVPSNRPILKNGILIWHFEVSYRPLLLSVPMWIWLWKQVASFDIIHIHGLYRFPVTSAAWWARRYGIPYIVGTHGSLDPFLYKQSRYNISLKRIYERLFDFPNLNNAAAIHYTSQNEAQCAKFLKLRSRPIILPAGINWEDYRCLPAKRSFRQNIKLDNQKPLVLFLGRINFKKGLDLLIPAFGSVKRKHPDAGLAIVGPDNDGYLAKVRQLCKDHGLNDNVFFVDHLRSDRAKEAYVDADVFVLPSYTENFGLTVVEAMASATPVVISDQVDIHREVRKAGAGIVVPLDPKKIAKAICRILEDKNGAHAMGQCGRKLAEERYAWPRIVEEMTNVYQRLIIEAASKRSFCRVA